MSSMARIDRLYAVMVELLNQPKTIDVMRKMPAYVKDGEVYDFNDRSFGATDKPDGNIFKDIERVQTVQAVTAALKRDYTAALAEWLGDVDSNSPVKKSVEKSKAEREEVAEPEAEIETDIDLVAEVKMLVQNEKFKKAKKLIKGFDGDEKVIKKAKKILKAAQA